ncbi:MAG: hypothetical protein DWQ19_12900 [Crenarchaeota archaeon]|nr:MAG: hypothetical protein DWQ19_12900 [Thermoproteota archaeon]
MVERSATPTQKGSIMSSQDYPRKCDKCKGEKRLQIEVWPHRLGRNEYPHGMPRQCIVVCDACNGKGYLTKEDVKLFYDQILCRPREK